MTIRHVHTSTIALLVACSIALTACGRDPAPPAADAGDQAREEGFIARTTRRALETASRELAEGNISVGGRDSGSVHINGVRFGGENSGSSHLPKAEISPQGDLLIDGAPVAVDEAQRQLLLAHRAHIIAIAQSGIEIGVQGAQLGAQAAKGALTSALAGKSEEFEARMEAEGAKIAAEAQKLCDQLPALYTSQQTLAGALPAFAPYATMKATAADECRRDIVSRDNPAAEADAAADGRAQ